MLARKRNQIHDMNVNAIQRCPTPTATAPSQTQTGTHYTPKHSHNHNGGSTMQPYQPPFTTVPTDGTYPLPPPDMLRQAHGPSTQSLYLRSSEFRLKDPATYTYTHAHAHAYSPIPTPPTITHALLQRDALRKFHTAVYIADLDAGPDDARRRQMLGCICEAYMPAMRALGVAKHQIVFFYHGRGEIEMGNAVWEAMGLWEGEREGERAGVGLGTGRGRWVRRGEEGVEM
ncbi:hypothetical protein LTR70_003176 [Exophiala xenobiotica]|uniref:Uncharacterized protein n=1 Tax=Lithohypha guttulata TaxID=1690604 RepID=A0ABR0KGI9_9EURO|nr:hypothetical protein LTR24_002821 [Lithohypha guttulata]KAK5323688.1 hypothetical protein LTR70_003176 [Exophiala xenobiotica]